MVFSASSRRFGLRLRGHVCLISHNRDTHDPADESEKDLERYAAMMKEAALMAGEVPAQIAADPDHRRGAHQGEHGHPGALRAVGKGWCRLRALEVRCVLSPV